MKRQYFSHQLAQESGIYLVLTAVMLVSVLGFFFFGVDVANLQLAKLRLQRAVDAAALVATANLDQAGSNWLTNQAAAEAVLLANLKSSGEDVSTPSIFNIQITPIPNSTSPRQVTVSATIPAEDVLLLDFLPTFWPTNVVSANAWAVNRRLGLVLILDVSGSMGNITSPPHICTTPTGGGGQCRKIDYLKQAANYALNQVDTSQDYVSVIAYNGVPNNSTQGLGVTVLQSMAQNVNVASLQNTINGLTANGYTNIEGALFEARNQLDTLNGTFLPEDLKVAILITDGAPTAGNGTILPGACNPIVPDSCGAQCNSYARLYEAAIRRSDEIRSGPTNGVVYSIALGPLLGDTGQPNNFFRFYGNPAPAQPFPFLNSPSANPYEATATNQIDGNAFVRRFLSWRLSNDQAKMQGGYQPPYAVPTPVPPPMPNVPPMPPFDPNCNPSPTGDQGQSWETNDPASLQPILAGIITRIRAKLND